MVTFKCNLNQTINISISLAANLVTLMKSRDGDVMRRVWQIQSQTQSDVGGC